MEKSYTNFNPPFRVRKMPVLLSKPAQTPLEMCRFYPHISPKTLYVEWSGDQHLEAEELKRWIATLPFVRLLTIEYAYDEKKARR